MYIALYISIVMQRLNTKKSKIDSKVTIAFALYYYHIIFKWVYLFRSSEYFYSSFTLFVVISNKVNCTSTSWLHKLSTNLTSDDKNNVTKREFSVSNSNIELYCICGGGSVSISPVEYIHTYMALGLLFVCSEKPKTNTCILCATHFCLLSLVIVMNHCQLLVSLLRFFISILFSEKYTLPSRSRLTMRQWESY